MKVFKEAHVKFRAERVRDVYMLRNSELIFGGLQLTSASKSEVVEQSETTMISSSDVQFYPERRYRLGGAVHNKKVQIVTLMVEQILINHVWIKEIVG